MTELQPKLIYLARRHPALTRTEFTARWRRHGALGMSLLRWKNIARYTHCDALPAPRLTSALAADIDGIGIIWHRSAAARAAHIADTGSREAMEQDERETFDRPIVETCAVTRESLLLEPNAAQAPLKITRFLTAHGEGHRDDIAKELQERAEQKREHLRKAGLETRGHILNRPLSPERSDRWGLNVDCIEELWFDGVETAVGAAEELSANRKLDGNVPAGCIQVLTNEVVLYDVRQGSES